MCRWSDATGTLASLLAPEGCSQLRALFHVQNCNGDEKILIDGAETFTVFLVKIAQPLLLAAFINLCLFVGELATLIAFR